MKQKVTLFILVCITCLACGIRKHKVLYQLPEAMSPAVAADYARICDKGVILYDINCSRCHNATVKGKTLIPDFTAAQIIGYEVRMSNPKHESNIPETKVTAEELSMIMTFLNYKKKSGLVARRD